jgi:hypothetical protein
MSSFGDSSEPPIPWVMYCPRGPGANSPNQPAAEGLAFLPPEEFCLLSMLDEEIAAADDDAPPRPRSSPRSSPRVPLADITIR